MKVVVCTRPVDTFLGETRLHVRYLVLREWSIEQENKFRVVQYDHYGIFLNTGTYYDLFPNRFDDDRKL